MVRVTACALMLRMRSCVLQPCAEAAKIIEEAKQVAARRAEASTGKEQEAHKTAADIVVSGSPFLAHRHRKAVP